MIITYSLIFPGIGNDHPHFQVCLRVYLGVSTPRPMLTHRAPQIGIMTPRVPLEPYLGHTD